MHVLMLLFYFWMKSVATLVTDLGSYSSQYCWLYFSKILKYANCVAEFIYFQMWKLLDDLTDIDGIK